MVQLDHDRRGRIGSAIGVAALHAALGYALLTGLGVVLPAGPSHSLKLFDVAEPPPPPPVTPAPARARRTEREGSASPANVRSRPSPVVIPPPRIRLDLPPVPAAPIPASGQDASAGASERAGPGSGSGGSGSGSGSGGQGTGTGGGGVAVRARLVAGRILDSDYPAAASRAHATGIAVVRLAVDSDGRVSGCSLVRSSGHAELDSATCRLARARFRYSPARDAEGRAVPDVVGWQQTWWQEAR